MQRVLLDVTDLVEFLQREESVSGVQRVIARTVPLLLERSGARAILLDRGRGVFVELSPEETASLLGDVAPTVVTRPAIAAQASACLVRAHTAAPLVIDGDTTMVFMGAVWISDALMMAARQAHAQGARMVYLLYDLTPVKETGHTAAVNRLFERYLGLVIDTASCVPAISASSRADFVAYCQAGGQLAPEGVATGLPCGILPGDFELDDSPWPRPYALFVGTVEARKNHLLALAAWRELIERHGADAVPDLVCIGRLGWHSSEFIDEYVRTAGLGGKVSLLSTSVSDGDLARFMAHALFTVYPSRYEGWGLPVSESLAFGKLPIVAHNSSLPEAGLDFAEYFVTDDVSSLVTTIEEHALRADVRREHERRIKADYRPLTWQGVADILNQQIDRANSMEVRQQVYPTIELGREYVIAPEQAAPDAGYSDRYMRHVQVNGLTPLLRQPRQNDDFSVVDAALIGSFGSPQTWGNEMRPGRLVDFRITRPVDGDLVVLFSTRSMPGLVTVEAAGPGGPLREDVYLGSVLTLPLGAGKSGEQAQVSFSVVDARDSIEGFLGIRSFVVLSADDLRSQTIALQSAAQALRQELDFMTGTRSWKLTAPLRRFKGRGHESRSD